MYGAIILKKDYILSLVTLFYTCMYNLPEYEPAAETIIRIVAAGTIIQMLFMRTKNTASKRRNKDTMPHEAKKCCIDSNKLPHV